jgi:hypothetical protein
MNKSTLVGGTAIAATIVVGALLSLQNFDAGKVACPDIGAARASLQATYENGVNASVQVYAGEKAEIDATLSRCLSASPTDPCADAQAARDKAVADFNRIPSPADSAPYEEFQSYFKKRDDAYNAYKSAKGALDQCRAANPPKPITPYEQSDTKACFDAYDASVASIRDTFEKNTQALKSALKAAMAALDAREKACNPPKGNEKFTDPAVSVGGQTDGVVPVEILNCQEINAEWDYELMVLRRRAAAIPTEIRAVQDGIKNAQERMSPLERDLRDVDTYIPPESTKTQYEGALNALRAERKVSIEAALTFYKNLIARRQAEKAQLEQELADINAKIAARVSQIQKENEARRRNFPTSVHLSKPDACGYYHCHGILCGRQDPAPHACGHGATTEADVECKDFIRAYLDAASR